MSKGAVQGSTLHGRLPASGPAPCYVFVIYRCWNDTGMVGTTDSVRIWIFDQP